MFFWGGGRGHRIIEKSSQSNSLKSTAEGRNISGQERPSISTWSGSSQSHRRMRVPDGGDIADIEKHAPTLTILKMNYAWNL